VALLAVDQGNSQTKWGLFVDGQLVCSWITPTEKNLDMTALTLALPSVAGGAVPALGVCSVIPELHSSWKALAERLDLSLTLFTGTFPTPLCNAYTTPETLGPDRLLAAVAAVACVGAPVLVVHLGTATVVDAVAAPGIFLGGMIAPGISTAQAALCQATSALTSVPWQPPLQAIGRSTPEAIGSGWFHHSLGAIRGMVAACADELGVPAPLVLTGGWARTIAPFLSDVARVDEFLILTGIATMLAE
jgi:type III pantothenate kinase